MIPGAWCVSEAMLPFKLEFPYLNLPTLTMLCNFSFVQIFVGTVNKFRGCHVCIVRREMSNMCDNKYFISYFLYINSLTSCLSVHKVGIVRLFTFCSPR